MLMAMPHFASIPCSRLACCLLIQSLGHSSSHCTACLVLQWPTFPQVYISGEFVGGADIMIQMYQSGELAELFERELNS